MRTNSVSLGAVEPARTRSLSRRSGVLVADDIAVVGLADGQLLAVDPETLTTEWTADGAGGAVSLVSFDGGVAVGGRDPNGTVRVMAEGETKWTADASDDVDDADEPRLDSSNFHPYVVDACADDERLYAAVRRTVRGDGQRGFASVIYAFEPSGDVRWRYATDACVSALSLRGGRLAVAYNRCPGSHDSPLVVLDAVRGTELTRWGGGGDHEERRVGDVALLPGGKVAVPNYADYRGYVLDSDGMVRWRADLATPRTVDGETVYAYPTRVYTTGTAVTFVTGSTYPRGAGSRHPNEHQLRCYSPEGVHQWDADVRGLTRELGGEGDRLLVPSAQNMWTRDAGTHGLQLFDLPDGAMSTVSTAGIVTAASLSGGLFAAVEEPIRYHDETVTRGAYRLHVGRVPASVN